MRSPGFPEMPASLAWASIWPEIGPSAPATSRAVAPPSAPRGALALSLARGPVVDLPQRPLGRSELSRRPARREDRDPGVPSGIGPAQVVDAALGRTSRPEGGADRLHAAGGRRPGDPAPWRAGRGHRVPLDPRAAVVRDALGRRTPVRPTARSPCPGMDADSPGDSTINRSRCAKSPAIGRRCWSRPGKTSGSISPRWAGRACWFASSTWADRGARIRCA